METVKGALGPLFYAAVDVAGIPVNAQVDTGSSATLTAVCLDKEQCLGKFI